MGNAYRVLEAKTMKSTKLISIIDRLIDNEVVKFEADDGTQIEIHKTDSGFYTLSTKSKAGVLMSATFFNRYEDDGGYTRLCWNASIVGMLFPVSFEPITESIYS